MPSTPQDIHHHTGSSMIAHLPYPSDNQGPKPLPKNKSGDENHIGKPSKTQVRNKSKNYHNDHWQMYRQKPLQCESIHIGTPVSKRDIDKQNHQANKKKFHSEANIPK
jgi:hypothetical protein